MALIDDTNVEELLAKLDEEIKMLESEVARSNKMLSKSSSALGFGAIDKLCFMLGGVNPLVNGESNEEKEFFLGSSNENPELFDLKEEL